MTGRTEKCFLVIGMLIYILDLTSDVWLGVQYFRNNESKWFTLTLSLIVITIVVTNIAACLQAFKDTFEGPYKWLWVFSICWPVLFRYVEELLRWKQANLNSFKCAEQKNGCTCDECKKNLEKKQNLAKSAYSLAWLHLIQTLTQSGPQFCLQVYIILNEWHFQWLTVLSASVSLLSLVWGITALERARGNKNGDSLKMGSTILFLTWQLFAIISRLSAVVTFAYVFENYVFCVLVFHWLVVSMAIVIHRKEEFKDEGKITWMFLFITSLFCVTPLLIFASESLLAFYKNRRLHTFILSIVLAIENIAMTAIVIGITKFGVVRIDPNVNVFLIVTAAFVFGGLVLEIAFCASYYKCCCRTNGTADVNEDTRGNAGESVDNPAVCVQNRGFDQC